MALLLAALLCSPPLEALVDRIAKAYGGAAALAKVHAVRESGTLETMRGVAQTERVFAPPDKLRVDIRYPDGSGELRVLSGGAAFRNGEPVQGPPRDAMLLQAARLDLPFLLLRNKKRLVDLGELQRDGKTLRGIGVPLESGLQVAIGVDPQTAMVVYSEGQLASPGGPVRFATRYSDFRPVNGVLFAFSESNFASGQHTGETRLAKIELLVALPPDALKP